MSIVWFEKEEIVINDSFMCGWFFVLKVSVCCLIPLKMIYLHWLSWQNILAHKEKE